MYQKYATYIKFEQRFQLIATSKTYFIIRNDKYKGFMI